MSKGRHNVSMRLDAETLAEVRADLAVYNAGPCNPERTLAEHCRALLREGLRHRVAGRRKGRGRKIAQKPEGG